jgi:cyanophycin synthetase
VGLIAFRDLDLKLYKTSTSLIVGELIKRGVNGYAYRQGSPYLFIDYKGSLIKFFSTMPMSSSRFDTGISNDKFITNEIAKGLCVPTLENLIFNTDDYGRVIDLLNRLKLKNQSLIIKPLDSAHGNGITVNISDEQELIVAIKYASKFSNNLVAQRYLKKREDIRVLCVGGRVMAIANRVPASVEGDGINSVEKLISISNESRSKDYSDQLVEIDIDRARSFLRDEMDIVPKKGEVVRVLGISNIGAGGTSIDVTNIIPEEIKQMALKLTSEFNMEVAGVDFLVNSLDLDNNDLTVSNLDPIFIELNSCPGLSPHYLAENLNNGKTNTSPRPIVERFVDYMLGDASW